MDNNKDIFKVEHEIRRLQNEAENELEDALNEQKLRYRGLNKVEELLDRMENADSKLLEKVTDEGLESRLKEVLEDIEKGERLLENRELEELKKYLIRVKDILQDAGLELPSEEEEVMENYYVKAALTELERAIEHSGVEEEITGDTERLLNRIESSDEHEIERIRQSLGEDNSGDGLEADLEKKFRKLWQETDKAKEHLENRNISEALEYVNDIGEILNAIEYDLDHIEKLEEKYQKDRELSGGSNATVYTLKNREDRLIKFHGTLRQSKKLKKYIDSIPDEVNIAPILEVGLYEGDPAEIIKRAPGKEVHQPSGRKEKMLRQLADADQQHYNKFVEDTRTLIQHGLKPDSSPENLFHHQEKGFTWIDPMPYNITRRIEKGLDTERPNFLRVVLPKVSSPDEKDKEKMLEVANKLQKADAPEPEKSIEDTLEEFIHGEDISTPDQLYS